MEKEIKKNLVWGKKDVISVVVVYVLNTLILAGIYLLSLYLNGKIQGSILSVLGDMTRFFNFILLLIGVVVSMAIYLFFENRDFMKFASNNEMLFLILEVSLLVGYFTGKYVNPYLTPFALVSLLALYLTSSRTALFMTCIYSVLRFVFDVFSGTLFNVTDYSIVFFFIACFSSGIIATYSMKGVYSRIKLISTSLFISIPVVVCILLPMIDFGDTDKTLSIISGVFSGPLSVVLFMVLLPVFEMLFKKVTSFKLAELTDHKAHYITKMITEAPGTFNHAIVVSNLAEACATAIGEDPLLARTCAYYHDVGKLRRPEFFKENQVGIVNPHDDLTPELSANIIKSHAIDGYGLALKSRLPKEIADVCREHHGTMPILFFYDKAKKFTDGEVPITNFCYSGPKPQTKIAAIIMIADGCEAIVRAITDRSREKVQEAVKKIIDERMELGQFDECEITLKELSIISQTIVNTLSGVYHERVLYPDVDVKSIEEKKEEKENGQA